MIVKRLGVFFFYDQDGVADRYVDYLLESMDPCLERLVVVSNGILTKESKDMFGRHTQKRGRQTRCLIERENKGFDVWAYRTALLAEGWERLEEYDEIVLFNHTIMGSLYPFRVMFEEMERVSADFWGISEHFGYYMDPTDENPFGYLPTHLQSHFIVCRRSLVKEKLFQGYWEHMPEIESYTDSVGKHESYFTKYFSDHGYQGRAYLDLSKLSEKTTYPMVDLPVSTVKQAHSPIFKRKSFFCQTSNFTFRGSGALEAQQLFRYLKDHTDYDTDLIVENMIRTCHQSDYAVYLDTLLRMETLPQKEISHSDIKIAIIGTEEERPFIQRISEKFDHCECMVLGDRNERFTVRQLLDIAKRSDYVCMLNLPDDLPDPYESDGFGYSEYRDELCRALFEKNMRNLSYILHVLSEDPLTGLIVAARLITLDHSFISRWKNLFSKEILHEDFFFQKEKIPQGTGLPFLIAKGPALAGCKAKIPSERMELDLLKTGCADFIVSLFMQQGGYLTKSILLESVGMANTNLQAGLYIKMEQAAKDREQAAKDELDRYKSALSHYSVRTALRLKIKRHFPRKIYAFLVKTKRAVFGPRGMGFSYDENPWENL